MRNVALALLLLSIGCGEPIAPADAPTPADVPTPLAYRGDALIVRLVTEAAARHQVPRDVLLTLGWAETELVSRTGEQVPGAHDADELDDHHEAVAACGLFGLDDGAVRDEAAALLGVEPYLVCEHPEVDANAAAARLRMLAGGDDAPPLDDTRAWLEVLDLWHPALAEVSFPYHDHLAQVMHLGFRGEDELGDAIYLPPVDGLMELPTLSDEDVGLSTGYARPDTPLANWEGPACDYQNASRGAAQIDYVVIHTCEGGFAGCLSTVRSCGGSVVSAHYVVSYTGYAAQVVEEQDVAWHVGCLNGSSVGIENEGFAGSTNHPDAQMCRTARITRSICDRYGIPCNRTHVIGHVEANSRFCGGSHWDPGPHWNWTRFMDYVQNGCDCRPTAETCDGRDQDCDRRIDEGVTNACGTCGATPVEACNGRDDDCDGTVDDDDVCEIDLLNSQPSAYAPPRSTDVDANGTADLCARGYGGVRCWTASATGWAAPWAAIPWSDTSGWNDVTNYATLRMGDVNGDGRADVCARSNSAFHCALSNGTGFEAATVWRDGISDANGWNHARYYTTLRLADVNADGNDDLCARDSQGFGCWLSNGTTFDQRIEGPRWANDNGWGVAKHYGTIRMGDLDGDRRADVCARSAAGMECWLSSGEGFPTAVDGPDWNGGNWGDASLWSTIRLIDFDGDGLGDLCARNDEGLTCARSNGAGFDEQVLAIALGGGWDDRANYATLRTGDIDGNGTEDLCVRSNTAVLCVAWDGTAFARVDGPGWSDESGWGVPQHYDTIRLADFDGDGRADVCARAGAGWRCHPSSGAAFGDAVAFDELTNAGGWDAHHYWSTIMSAGRACIAAAETCNGRDDDCDGEIDEEPADETCNGIDDDCDGEIDEHATDETCNDADDDCDGTVDETLTCTPPDGGVMPRADGGIGRADGGGGTSELSGGCGCRAAGNGTPAPIALGLLGLAVAIFAARRRR